MPDPGRKGFHVFGPGVVLGIICSLVAAAISRVVGSSLFLSYQDKGIEASSFLAAMVVLATLVNRATEITA